MLLSTQSQAKQFLIDKILFQAQKDRVPLSKAEEYMLGWTETEGGFELNQKLTDEFHEQTTNEDYEKKISTLIKHAYEADIHGDPAIVKAYHTAYRILTEGDHYLHVMIRQAFQEIPSDIKSDNWLKDKLSLIVAAFSITLVPIFIAIYFRLSDQWIDFMLTCIFLYLIPFSIYSFAVYRATKKNAHQLSTTKIILYQLTIAIIMISTYVLLITKFNIIDITSHPHDFRGFRFIISLPLLAVSIILLDFTFKRGIVYDGIKEFINDIRKKT